MLVLLCAAGLIDRAETEAQEKPLATSAAKPFAGSPAVDDATSTYFVEGTVTEEGTGIPVTEAEIQILVRSEQDPDKRTLFGTTDDKGRYRIAVPMGQVNLWFPSLKPGYWLPSADCMKSLVTSPDQPTASCDLVAKTGPVWNVQAIGLSDDPMLRYVSVTEVADDKTRAAWKRGENVSFQQSPEQWNRRIGVDGKTAFTEVGESRKFLFGVGNVMGELIVDKEFDNTQVVSAEESEKQSDDGVERKELISLIDRAGHTATISGAEVTLSDGVPLLTVRIKKNDPIGVQSIRGKVVDVAGEPLSGVRVGLARGKKKGGSAATGQSVDTDAKGDFHFQVEQFEQPKQGRQYSVSLIKDAEKYQDRDVVFLGIHTADGNVADINKLKKLKNWTSPSAVDQGTSIQDGVTCKAYGISGYPTIVIIDAAGKIAYRSDIQPPGVANREAFMAKMQELAKSNGLHWPGDDAPREEAEAFMNRMQVIMLSQQLDQLLQTADPRRSTQ